MSMLEYAISFGDTIKENAKRLTKWNAYYYTGPDSWYPPPDGAPRLEEIPILTPLPAPRVSHEVTQMLRDFASVYGKAVRQRSTRSETTKAKAGTLPQFCYSDSVTAGDRMPLTRNETPTATVQTEVCLCTKYNELFMAGLNIHTGPQKC